MISEKINFNLEENQHRCIPVNFPWLPNENGKYQFENVGIDYFLKYRNFGWGIYEDQLYNLNVKQQAEELLSLLEMQKFFKNVKSNYVILDPMYDTFPILTKPKLLFIIGRTKVEKLTDNQSKLIDKFMVEAYQHFGARVNELSFNKQLDRFINQIDKKLLN